MGNELDKKVDELYGLMDGARVRMSDWDVLSAIGIADSQARGGNCDIVAPKFDGEGKPANRDGLALRMIEMIRDLDVEASKYVRAEARWQFNAPYRSDPKTLAWREKRAERGKLEVRSE